jgi:hypothetical protein
MNLLSEPQRRAAVEEAYRDSVRLSKEDIAGYLQEVLGSKLVAFIASVKDDAAVGQWASGKRGMSRQTEDRLRAAYQVFAFLQKTDNNHVVRAWFIGMNPQLDDISPAEALREGREKDVMAAARSFVQGG